MLLKEIFLGIHKNKYACGRIANTIEITVRFKVICFLRGELWGC